MKRICPVCKKTLTSSSVYFCEYCGVSLPDDLQLKSTVTNVIKKVGTKKIRAKKEPFDFSKIGISMRSVVAGVLLGIALSLIFFQVFKFISTPRPLVVQTGTVVAKPTSQTKIEEPHATEDSSNVVEGPSGIKSGNFGQYDIYSYIPYDASLYFESNDSSTLGSYFSFMGGDFFTLYEGIKDDLQPFYGAFHISKGLKSGWVIVAFTVDGTKNPDNFDTIYTKLSGNVLVISHEPILIDEVTLANTGISKNLALHPSFISIKDNIPESGKELIFKVSKDGDASLDGLIKNTLSEEFKETLVKFRGSGSSYMVFK